MSDSYITEVDILHAAFDTGFMEAYKDISPTMRKRILVHLQALYRRWFYSAVVENTPFSPANIMESICLSNNVSVSTYPIATFQRKGRYSNVGVSTLEYSMDKHPIVDDFKILLEYCKPSIDLLEDDCFSDAQSLDLCDKLSLKDPYYASFLLQIALSMGLLVKMPSLYVNRVQRVKNCDEILSVSSIDLFREIVETSITLSSYNLNDNISLPGTFFTESFVRSILKEPMETDCIFERLFNTIGYSLNDMTEPPKDGEFDIELDSFDAAFLSGAFMMGVVLDRYFYTPFSQFLRLIKPLYVIPFDLRAEIDEYISMNREPDQEFIAFFAPCSGYELTSLGSAYFELPAHDYNYFDENRVMPFKIIKEAMLRDKAFFLTFVKVAKDLPAREAKRAMGPKRVYTFRARMESNPSLWAHLSVADETSLHEFYRIIIIAFKLDLSYVYSFFHDVIENPFLEYVPPDRIGVSEHAQMSTKVELCDLDFAKQNQMILKTLDYDYDSGFWHPGANFKLELMSEKIHQPGDEYTEVSRMSKALKQQIMDDTH